MIIDTHIHLDDERYRDDLEEVISRAKEKGVESYIIPGADAKTLPRAVEIAEAYDSVYFAVGIHPYDIDSYSEENFHDYVNHPKCVAIGECGLDYFRLEGSNEEKEHIKQKQKEVFIEQIKLAKHYRKPLIVHIRDASHDSRMILESFSDKTLGGVLHCFNADEELLSLSKMNFYFGIGGVVTFKNAKKLIKVLEKIPYDKLLLETDGPYLTPEPHRGSRNEPAYTSLVAEKIADVLGRNKDEIESNTTTNAKSLFKI